MLKKNNGAVIYPLEFSHLSNTLLVKNGRVIDPVNKIDGVMDVLVEDGFIKAIGHDIYNQMSMSDEQLMQRVNGLSPD